ncbi:zinc finger protein 761 isoform X2 [Aedes albopictus]|uniref:C2h2-type zn-finger protein n=1 Tax=Aedes albopictus TaxID=7160 RepID=A0ABM1ZK62_AEDAL
MTSDEAWSELPTELKEPECSLEICRLCMSTESLENLFEVDGLRRWITDYLSIMVSTQDNISHAICTICRIRLDEFHQFRMGCLEVQTTLWSMAQTGKIVEPPKQSRSSDGSGQRPYRPIKEVLEKDGQYQCATCGKVFDNRKRVWDHKRIHGPKKYRCMQCGKSFSIRRYLQVHMMTHISDELEEESPQKEHEMLDLQAVKIEPLGEIDSIAALPRSEHSLEGETAFEDEGSSYGAEQEESRTESHTEEATADRIEIGLVKIEEPAGDDMEEDAVSQNAELEANADQRDLHFEVGLENAEPETSRSNTSMHSEMEEVCAVETNVRRKKGTRNVKANSKIDDCGQREDKILEITQEKQQHRCNKCSKAFSTSSKLKDHLRLVHGERKLACHICGKRFILPSRLRLHGKKHNSDKPFKCDICGKTFKHGQSLWHHNNILHGAQHSCTDCGIYFPLRRQLEGHLRTNLHKINVEMRANSKNEKVSDESGSNDTTDVTNKRTNEVDKAEEAQPDTAGSAQQQQQQQKHYQCNTCSKMFWKKRQLDDHTRLVHGEKNFVCSVCNKRFVDASRLRSHMRRHDKTKPYKCAKCGKCYKAEKTLANHERIQHNSGDSIQMLRKETFDNGRSPSASS